MKWHQDNPLGSGALVALLCMSMGCSGDGPEIVDSGSDALDAADTSEGDTAGDPASDAPCQAPEEIEVSLTVTPHIGEAEFDESGTVQSIDTSDPESASFTVHFPGLTSLPPDQTYTVPITSGDLLDLSVADEVQVRFAKEMWDDWMQTALHVERDGATVLYYLDCFHHCAFMFMETSPLTLDTLSGACEPAEDIMGCAMLERRGYRGTCPPSMEPVYVFDHNSATVTCDADYLIMIEDHTVVTEHLMTCAGVPDNRIEFVLLRLQ